MGLLTTGAVWASGCSDSFSTCQETHTCKRASTSAGQSGEGGTEPSDGGSGLGGADTGAGTSSGGSSNGTGGDSISSEGGGGGQPTTVDVVAPTILSISPDNGEAGVASDATIEITFSEAMDKVATQAAFQSANLGDVTFDWPSDDVMVVTPNEALEYATGTSLTTAAKTYNFAVTTAAQDDAGNALKKATLSEFSTLRRITTIVPEKAGYYSWNDGEGVITFPAPHEPGAGVQIGDWPAGAGLPVNWQRALLVFDLSGLPTGVESFVSAELSVSMCCAEGNPALLGAVSLQHIFLSPIDQSFFEKAPLDTPGVLASPASAGVKKLSVVNSIEVDYAQRVPQGNESQFRVEFAVDRNEDVQRDGIILDDTSKGAPATQILVTFLIQ